RFDAGVHRRNAAEDRRHRSCPDLAGGKVQARPEQGASRPPGRGGAAGSTRPWRTGARDAPGQLIDSAAPVVVGVFLAIVAIAAIVDRLPALLREMPRECRDILRGPIVGAGDGNPCIEVVLWREHMAIAHR